MHISRQSPQELVIVSGTRWISAICATAAIIILYFIISRHEPKAYFFLVAFILFFAFIMDLRKTFTFDATHRIVRWKGRKVFKAESGEIPFDDITGIDTEINTAASRSGGNEVPIYRLTIITPQATIPMSYSFNGGEDRFATLRTQILSFIKHDSTT